MLSVALAPGVWAQSSDEQLRQFLERIRPQPPETGASSAAVRAAAALPPERLKERSDLLAQGELDLSNLKVETAQHAFEKAALILHAADSEMALVRSYMQAGEYRRALAFGAHTAGAHLDVVGSAALYAWLLHSGGQHGAAKRLLAEADARVPNQAIVKNVQQQLASGSPVASGEQLSPPTRLAPYASTAGLPASARVIASAVLLPGAASGTGSFALVPLASLASTPSAPALSRAQADQTLWLRNGLGQLSSATLEEQVPSLGVALLRLAAPLPLPDGLVLAAADPFPGSTAYTIEYPVTQIGRPLAPAWPQLHMGFMGAMALPDNPTSTARLMGISLPAGPRGGGLFNAAGQFTGLAVPAANYMPGAPDLLVTIGQLRQALGSRAATFGLALEPGQPGAPRAAPTTVDRIYEAGLKNTLQLISSD